MSFLTVHEPAAVEAIARALGHGPPFEIQECRRYAGRLALNGVHELAWLPAFESLAELELQSCGLTRLALLSPLRALRRLGLGGVPLASLAGVEDLRLLRDLDLAFTHVETVAPLRRLGELRGGRVIANPLSPGEHEDLTRLAAEVPLEIPTLGEWRATRRLFELGREERFGLLHTVGHVMVVPGRAGAIVDTTWLLQHEILTGEDRAVRELVADVNGLGGLQAVDLLARRVIGGARDAREWISAGELDPASRAQLLTFVDRFPNLAFYRETQATIEAIERRCAVGLPPWFRRQLSVLAGVFTRGSVEVRLLDGNRYELGLAGRASEYEWRLGLYPIGSDYEHGVTLAIGLDPAQPGIHRMRDGEVAVAFPSFAALLDAVTDVQISADA